ncbi:MAG: hypothetical protein M3437_10525 [Chloroflexota bacterium]|nr:hypothetical protein [Chloroflexota bacterium]MDQ5866616.1 hypothetical protein [Chloroflexota bacterium]
MADTHLGESVHRLPLLHVQSKELKQDPDAVVAHLYQLNESPGAYFNKMGCGAFTTTMAISHYHPTLGTYNAARTIFGQMLKVPFFGGTFESQNARIARQYGLLAKAYSRGTINDLIAAIDCGAPTILLVQPRGLFRIGQFEVLPIGRHDVLLLGYSRDGSGKPLRFFTDNPAVEKAPSQESGEHEYPGNEAYTVPALLATWTRCFTPIFGSADAYARWRTLTGRD